MRYFYTWLLICVILTVAASESFGQFSQVGGASGAALTGGKDGGVAWGDYNNDGCLDLLVNTSNTSGYSRIYLSDCGSPPAFTQVTNTIAPDLLTNVTERSAIWGDYNNDGNLDFAVNANPRIEIYTNSGAPGYTFTRDLVITAIPGGMNSEGLGWLDYNNDGWLDLIVENHSFGIDIYENPGNGTAAFTHATPNGSSLGLPEGGTSGDYMSVTDFNNDGFPDILARKEDDLDLWVNNGNGTFTANTSFTEQATNSNKGGVLFCDFDNDGDFDIYWSDGGTNQIWLQTGLNSGNFTATNEPAASSGVTPANIDGCACADVDNNGTQDLFLNSNSGAGYLYINNTPNGGTLNFTRNNLGINVNNNGEGCAFGDYDNDGDQDLYLNVNNSNNQLWENTTNNTDYLRVELKRCLSGGLFRDDIGATVVLKDCGGNVLSGIRELNGGRGHGSQDAAIVHFGLPSGNGTQYVVEASFINVNGTRSVVEKVVVPSGLANQTITITDCSTSDPPGLINTTMAVTSNYNGADVTCPGANDGAAQVTLTGGLAPYTYLWDANAGSQTTDSATALTAGLYFVTVTDSAGCTFVDSIEVTDPDTIVTNALAVSNFNGSNISCNGESDGAIAVVASAGVGGFSYLWDPNAGNSLNDTVLNLGAGSYVVTVTDANGCTIVDTATLVEPAVVTATAAIASNYNGPSISCAGGNDGAVAVAFGGGTPGYTFLWDAGTGNQTTDTAQFLMAGTYTVTVTDTNGCFAIDSIAIIDPAALAMTINILTNYNGQDVSCNGASDGQALAQVAGGTGSYTYQWGAGTGNQTTDTAFNLAAGDFFITVTDTNGCVILDTVTLTEPLAITSFTAVTSNYAGQDVKCPGSSDGEATVTASGGTGTLTYLWDTNAASQTTAIASNLSAGTYFVTVTDTNGCTVVDSVTLNDPVPITGSTSVISGFNGQDVSCNGATDGQALVVATGGTGTLTYTWGPGTGNQANDTASNLGAGTYFVTVTDTNACVFVDSITITEPDSLLVTLAVTSNFNGQDVSCVGAADGAVTATVTGGTTPYNYLWPGPGGSQTTQTAIGLNAGTYTVVVTDHNNCNVVDSITVNDPPAITSVTSVASNFNGQDVSCSGASDGAAVVVPSGGVAPYTYSWDGNAGNQTTDTAFGLMAGMYLVTVTDTNGCDHVASITLNDPPPMSDSIAVVSDYNGLAVSCQGAADGIAVVYPFGGTPGYTFQWDTNAASQTTDTAFNLTVGTYFVTVTDANGCSIVDAVVVSTPQNLLAVIGITSNYNSQPVSCNGASDGELTAIALGGVGPYSVQWGPNAGNSTMDTVGGISAGTYALTITDANGCDTSTTILIGEPDTLEATIGVISNYNGEDITCFGDTTGEAEVVPIGGTSPYFYQWDANAGNQTNATAFNLGAGTFSVTVTDNNGCDTVYSVTLNDPPPLTASLTNLTNFNGFNLACQNDSNGMALAAGGGGVAPYFYNWDAGANNQVTDTAFNLPAGTYIVTITDNNGCDTSLTTTLTNPPALTGTTTITSFFNGVDVSCLGASDGSAIATLFGGVPGYAYQWDANAGSATTDTVGGLSAGQYFVTVTDTNGCDTVMNVVLTEPTGIGATIGVTSAYNGEDVSCFGGADGEATVTGQGGTTPYFYQWDANTGGLVGPVATGLTAGTFSVTVADANGCDTVLSVTLGEPTPMVLTTDSLITTCFGGSDGEASVMASGGIGPYTYNWNSGSTNDTASGLFADTYTVTVTDHNGCTMVDTVTVIEPTQVIVTTSPDDTVCPNAPTVLSSNATGGAGFYGYVWDSGLGAGQNKTITPTATLTYTVVATDANGCSSPPASVTITIRTPDFDSLDVLSGGNICPGGTSSVTGLYLGDTSNITFNWNIGPFGSALGPFTVNPGATSTYVLTATDDCGFKKSDSVTIVVSPVPQIALQDTMGKGCPTLFVAFANNAANPAGTTYLWDFGDGTTSSDPLPVHDYATTGLYPITLTLTSPFGCTNTSSGMNWVRVYPEPVAGFSPMPAITNLDSPEVQFIDSTFGAVFRNWDYGDGNFDLDSINHFHHYRDTGTYNVELIVGNTFGCQDTAVRTVIINPVLFLEIPNAFTPSLEGPSNGFYDRNDRTNDVFYPTTEYVDVYLMQIYNRWGELIFESKDLNIGWDGYYKGTLAPLGVYVYRIEVTYINGEKVEKAGDVTLIR